MRSNLTQCNRYASDVPSCLLHGIATLILVAGMASASIGAAVADENEDTRRVPNIVLIMADDKY